MFVISNIKLIYKASLVKEVQLKLKIEKLSTAYIQNWSTEKD